MHLKKKHIFCLIFLICCTTNSIAQTKKTIAKTQVYYLSSAGNDANPGTKNQPWKTIQKINTFSFKSGNKILLRAGDTFKGTLQLMNSNIGKPSYPLIISSYGKGKAIIDAGNETAIHIEKSSFITIKHLNLIGTGRKGGNTKDGISLTNCSNILIKDFEVNGFQNAGVSVYASSYISIKKVYAHDNGYAGISISGEYPNKNSSNNIYIGYCKADNNPGSPAILNNHSGNGIVAGFCSKLVIEYCTATNNGWDMPRIGNGPVGIWCYEADSVVIQHCVSYRNKTAKGGDDGGGFDLDGGVTNSIIQYCLSYENQGSGFGIFQYAGASNWQNNIIRYNISENDGTVSAAGAGIYIWNSSDDSTQFKKCLFYNNTIYNKKGAAISYASQSERKEFAFYNNIFVAGNSLIKGNQVNDVFLANNWWSLNNKFNIQGIVNLKEWTKKYDQEKINGKVMAQNINPGFNNMATATVTSFEKLKQYNGYKIPANSTLKFNGLNLHSMYGFETGNFDLNEKTAPVQGIGACFY